MSVCSLGVFGPFFSLHFILVYFYYYYYFLLDRTGAGGWGVGVGGCGWGSILERICLEDEMRFRYFMNFSHGFADDDFF